MKQIRVYARNQSGYVLITGLIFILVVTIVSISSMQSSNLNYKISTNEVFKTISFQGSESGRAAAGDAVSEYVYAREWEGNFSGLSWDENYDPSTDDLETGEDLYSTDTLTVDMEYEVSHASIENIESDISIVKAPGVSTGGSGLQQLSAYEGLGKGAGAGGIHLTFEIRSTGRSSDEAVSVTASEYRVFP